MKRIWSPFAEYLNECRALAKLRKDVRIFAGTSSERFLRIAVQQSRAFRFYWFTRCMEGAQ